MSDDNVLGFRATETVRRMRLAIYYERKFAEAIAAAIIAATTAGLSASFKLQRQAARRRQASRPSLQLTPLHI